MHFYAQCANAQFRTKCNLTVVLILKLNVT